MNKLLSLICLLLLTSGASAQDQGELPVDIALVKPGQIYLVPGGETKSIRLQGLGFECVERVEAFVNGDRKAKLRVQLKTVSLGIYTLLVAADPDAPPSSEYRIQLQGKSEFRKVPLTITVIDPQNPPYIQRD